MVEAASEQPLNGSWEDPLRQRLCQGVGPGPSHEDASFDQALDDLFKEKRVPAALFAHEWCQPDNRRICPYQRGEQGFACLPLQWSELQAVRKCLAFPRIAVTRSVAYGQVQ